MTTSTTTATRTATTGSPKIHRPGRGTTITAWVLQIGLGFAIASGGLLKLTADPDMVDMFTDISAGQWLRVLVGLLEVAGGVGLLVRRVRAVAALCLLILLLCATITNVTVLDASPLSALAFAAAALAIVLLRRYELPTALTMSSRPS